MATRGIWLIACVILCAHPIVNAQDAATIAVRNALNVEYVPKVPLELPPKWNRWIGKVDEIIGIVAATTPYRTTGRDIAYEALRAGIDPDFLLVLVEFQSRFNERAVSASGGIGLLRIAPKIQSRLGNPQNTLYQGQYNLRLGCALLRYQIDVAKGDLSTAVERFLKEVSTDGHPHSVELSKLLQVRKAALSSVRPDPK